MSRDENDDWANRYPGIFQGGTPPEPLAEGNFDYAKPEHQEFPPIIIMAVTNVCNMACIHCPHPIIKQKEALGEVEAFEKFWGQYVDEVIVRGLNSDLEGRWNDIKMCEKCQDWQHMQWNHGFEKAINRVLNKD